jgi:hypothetical protein
LLSRRLLLLSNIVMEYESMSAHEVGVREV